MIMDAFTLAEKVVLVAGAKRGAIYDLRNGAVYSVDENSKALLLACEKGKLLSRVFSLATRLSPDQCITYLDKLCADGLGRYCSFEEASKNKNLARAPLGLEFIWLEIIAGCNLRCVHCYEQGRPPLIGSEKMRIGDWRRIINESRDLGCERLQFIGGEPLLLGDDLISLIKYARSTGFIFIEVFTNATLVTDKFVSAFVGNNVRVAVSFYGKKSETHELVTLSPGSHKRTIKGIKKLVSAGIELRASVIGMRQNEDEHEEAVAYLKEIGVKKVRFDVVRPSGRGKSAEIVSGKLLESVIRKHPIFPPCTEDVFMRRVGGHNCFSAKICVSTEARFIRV